MEKIVFGNIHADYLTRKEAIERIVQLALDKKGGYIVTPNVDHIVMSEKNSGLQRAYADAALSLADGKPLIWMSHFLGNALPEKISGSDLIRPLLKSSAKNNLRIYLLGSAPGVGVTASEILSNEIPDLEIVGVDAPPVGFDTEPEVEKAVLDKMLSTNPDIVLVALGAPKQELLMYRWYVKGCPFVMLGIGASLDFIAGKVKRAPGWVSNIGLEWLFRLLQDPKRLAKRYLIRDIGIIRIFFRMLKTRNSVE